MTAKDIIIDVENKMKKTIESTRREFSAIRTGIASPALVEGIHVEYYGTPTPLKQLATISIPDPRLILIQPWDISIIGEVEKAILKSDLGITPFKDGKSIKIGIPQLSQERRQELVKVTKRISEDSKVSIRTIRRDANETIKKLEKDKAITEDESFSSQEQVQKLTDNYIKKIDELLAEKDKEIMAF